MTKLDVFAVDVSEKTTWLLFRLTGPNGTHGAGEATLNNRTDDVLGALPSAVDAATQKGSLSPAASLAKIRRTVPGVVGRAIASGLEQAWLDREGVILDRPVHDLLGGAHRALIPSYANINRGTLSRSPEEFADRAARAIADGYAAVKLAPFDGVTPDDDDYTARGAAIEAGFQRIEATTSRLFAGGRVQVDCHSRFRQDELDTVLARVAELGVSWFEEPVKETDDALETIARLRQRASNHGVTLAGAEKCADARAFLPFIQNHCYDVVMPDIILAGGPREVVRIGHLAAAFDCQVSLHNPCGPVMDMHSVHVAAAVPQLHSLERQFRETPLYDEIIERRDHELKDGAIALADTAGLGLRVDWTHPAIRLAASYAIDV